MHGKSERTSKKIFVGFMVTVFALFVFGATIGNKKINHKNMEEKKFAAVVNCMDGRVQDAAKDYMKERYGVNYVDVITEAGPNKILADNTDKAVVNDVKKRIEVSTHHHGAKVIALVGHFGCAGNPVSKEEQIQNLRDAKKTVESFGLGVEVILLWVGAPFEKAELVE